jgi:hypothetical protein
MRQIDHGKGAYTAEDAVYSHDYRHNIGSGEAQMLLVRVAAGRIFDIAERREEHKAIKTPPTGHDSVRGNVSTKAVPYQSIILYQPDSTYPAYVLTYDTR